ncbi:hypothetical protein D3M49_20035 [Klebsiella pneumoniae]|nr:hypothetical protein [Klebsiella pneumoniae]
MLKKTALSCAASAFTAVPGRDCHQQPSSHNPHNPSTTCQPLPFPLAPQTSLKVISIFSHTILISIFSHTILSHIFQKVLINAFLLLTHSAVKY